MFTKIINLNYLDQLNNKLSNKVFTSFLNTNCHKFFFETCMNFHKSHVKILKIIFLKLINQ